MRLHLAVPGTDASRALLCSARLNSALEYGRAERALHSTAHHLQSGNLYGGLKTP